MISKREAHVNTVIEAQRTVVRTVWDSIARDWLDLDLSMGQLKVLFVLYHAGATPVGGVADKLQIGLPAASVVVDKMVQMQLVERHEDPQDRRRTLVRLTANGEKLARDLREGRREQLRDWLERLNDGDLAALAKGLDSLAQIATREHIEIKA